MCLSPESQHPDFLLEGKKLQKEMTDGNDYTKQALQECKRIMQRHRLPRVGREVRPGLAAVWSARPSWRVVSPPLIPVLSLWLTQAKFIAAQCSWAGSITTAPWEPGKIGQTPSVQL